MIATITISNSGGTPAFIDNIKFSSGWDRAPVDHDQRMKMHEALLWKPRSHTVAPGANKTIWLPIEQLPVVDAHDIHLLEMDIREMFFIVTIAYADFRKGRETQCYLLYHPEFPDLFQHAKYNRMT